jgi:uncharacterized protein
VKFDFYLAGRGAPGALPCALVAIVLGLAGCDRFKSAPESAARAGSAAREHLRFPNRTNTSPRLAIILDDIASEPAAVEEIFTLPYPLTLAVLPLHEHSASIAEAAHRRGYQVMLHLPMEAMGKEVSEKQQLHLGMNSSEMGNDLQNMLSSVPFAVGVNNHQGSLATSNPQLMAELMPLLRQRHLFFIDSRTTAATVAFDTAERAGVRCAFRNVPFLDDVAEAAAIRHQLQIAIHSAKEKGEAVAIGHPHPETLQALREMLPQVEAQGVQLVHASALVH